MKLNFITNLDYKEVSGGGTAVNFATVEQLKRFFDVIYLGPVAPLYNKRLHFISKLKRIAGIPADYFAFSNERLCRISNEVMGLIDGSSADVNFFHGFTSWIRYESELPYFTFSDASFYTYVNIFNRAKEFSKKDLTRIFDLEKVWLEKAEKVFFRSHWALNQTKQAYGMKGDNFRFVGFGGFMEAPEKDHYQPGGNKLLFLAREFVPKGGLICFEAYKILREEFPQLQLSIIGEKPPPEVSGYPGVTYYGLVNKNIPEELKLLRTVLSDAYFLVHPTIKDVNPLVVTEAGYFGCPAIAPASFAIPELITDEKTGFLIDAPPAADQIVNKLRGILRQPERYLRMRMEVRNTSLQNFNWNLVGERIADEIKQSMLNRQKGVPIA